MSDEDYLNGWNDRREREKAILNAIENPTLNDIQLNFLMQIRQELENNGESDD